MELKSWRTFIIIRRGQEIRREGRRALLRPRSTTWIMPGWIRIRVRPATASTALLSVRVTSQTGGMMDMESLMPIVFLDVGRAGEGRKKGAQSGRAEWPAGRDRADGRVYVIAVAVCTGWRNEACPQEIERRRLLAAQVGAVHSALWSVSMYNSLCHSVWLLWPLLLPPPLGSLYV